MSIDSMRVGGGRCPPLLVGGLFVVCLMLIINWYTISSENLELLRQIDELNEQLKISAEERDQCVTLRGNLEQRFKNSEDEIASLHVRLAQQFELKKQNGELEISLTACKTELESLKEVGRTRLATLEALRLDKERISSQFAKKQEENKNLQEELDKVKSDLETAKLASNTPEKKKMVEIAPRAIGRDLNKGQLKPVPESAVKVSPAGQRGLKFHGVPILPQEPSGVIRQTPRFSVTMLHGNKDDSLLHAKIKYTQTNENSKNSVEIGGDQELLQGRGELEDIEDGNNPPDDPVNLEELQNVEEESQKDQQKVATNKLLKSLDPTT